MPWTVNKRGPARGHLGRPLVCLGLLGRDVGGGLLALKKPGRLVMSSTLTAIRASMEALPAKEERGQQSKGLIPLFAQYVAPAKWLLSPAEKVRTEWENRWSFLRRRHEKRAPARTKKLAPKNATSPWGDPF